MAYPLPPHLGPVLITSVRTAKAARLLGHHHRHHKRSLCRGKQHEAGLLRFQCLRVLSLAAGHSALMVKSRLGRGAGHWAGGGARVKRELMQCNEPQLLVVVVVDLVHARTHRDGSIALTAPNYDRPIYRPLPKLDPLGAAGTDACL